MKGSIKVFSFVALTFLAASGQKKTDDADENRAYEFGFKIAGEQHRHEKKDVNGIIEGEFGFITADGIYHVTVYATDENGDFHILSMRNVRISAPLDGSPLPPGAKISGQQPGGAPPVQPPTQRPFQALTTKNPKAPYVFTTQPTIKPACGGCGYVTTPKPRPGEKFPFQNPKFQSQNPNAIPNEPYSSNPNAPATPYQNAAPGNQYQNTPGSPYQNTPNAPGSPYQNSPNEPGSPYQNIPNGNPVTSGINPADPNYSNENVHYPVDNNNNNPDGKRGGIDIRYQEQGHPQNPNAINPLSSNPNAPALNQPLLSEIKNPDGSPYYPNQGQPDYPSQQSNYPQTPSRVSVDNNVIHVPGNPDIPIRDKYPGMVDGLPNGIEQKDISDLLYKFNYTVGFHGHYETGYKNGAKIGGYFVNGRDGISRSVTYVADENGYRPKVKFIRLGLDSDDTPKEATEKSFGLKNFEFVWYPLK